MAIGTDRVLSQLEMMRQAFADNEICWFRAVDERTGEPAVVICRYRLSMDGENAFLPFAVLIDEKLQHYRPPADDEALAADDVKVIRFRR
jgi:hypothetical protein